MIIPLSRPRDCEGCPLDPIAEGFMRPTLSQSPDRYRVALIGEALGEEEAKVGAPFQGRAGFKLTRLIEWAGLDRSLFDIYNTVWCRPPDNKLEGMEYERGAVSHCRRTKWGGLVSRSNVLVPLGNVATGALLGEKGILRKRGYLYPSPDPAWSGHILPTVHPSFIQRGQSKYSAPFIHDIQKAVEVARDGLQTIPADYLIDPLPSVALKWAEQLLADSRVRYLSYDIETPGKGEDEGDTDLDDPTYFIYRIGFSGVAHSGLSIEWKPEFIPTIKLLLGSSLPKVVWNAAFDNPRILAGGVNIAGVVHDGMVAWHILHSDLPKGLGFVATFTCPDQPAWKHMSHSHPGWYNATDADVELRSMLVIETELKKSGLWDVYQNDVLDLDPILLYMTERGMPIDQTKRLERAISLDERLKSVLGQMETIVPESARRVEQVYVNIPKLNGGLRTRPATRRVTACSVCGAVKPRKDHFKHYVRKVNPCDAGTPEQRLVDVVEYYRLATFTPSRDQLIRYNSSLSRPTPLKRDKKSGDRRPTMDEKAIKEMIRRYPADPLYPLVLEFRELDKIAGTYIGRPV